MSLLQKLKKVAIAGLIASAIIPSGCSLENTSKTQNRTYEKNSVPHQSYQKPKETNHTREEFFPTLAEFINRNFDIEGYETSGDISKILNLIPYSSSIAYHKKIGLIHKYPEQALEKLTDEEENNLKSFFNRPSNIDDPSNLTRTFPEINWREILESDYSSYKVIPSFDSIGDYDALVIFFHESFYEQKINFSKPKEDSKDEITLLRAPLYIEVSGTRKNGERSNFIANLFNVRYYLRPSQLEPFSKGLPSEITDEQSLNQIIEFVTGKGILLGIENFREINIPRELREKLLSPDFSLTKLASSNARKYLESDEFQENKERLVALREEYTFGETLSILSSIPGLLRDTVKLSQAVGETSRDIGKDLGEIIAEEISSFSDELTEEIDKSLPGYRARMLKRKHER